MSVIISVPHDRYCFQKAGENLHNVAFEYYNLFNSKLNKAMTIQVMHQAQEGHDFVEEMKAVHFDVKIKDFTKAQEKTKSLSKRNMIEKMDADESLALRIIASGWSEERHYADDDDAKRVIAKKFSPLIAEIHSFLFEDDTYANYSGVIGTW